MYNRLEKFKEVTGRDMTETEIETYKDKPLYVRVSCQNHIEQVEI
jgi:hypothetical protein